MSKQTTASETFREVFGREPDPHILIPVFACDLHQKDDLPYDWRRWVNDAIIVVVDPDFSEPHEAKVAKVMIDAKQNAEEHQKHCIHCTDRTFVATRLTEPDWLWLSDHHPRIAADAVITAMLAWALDSPIKVGFE